MRPRWSKDKIIILAVVIAVTLITCLAVFTVARSEEREYTEGDDIIKQNGNEDDFIILYDGKCHSDKISDSGKTQPLLKYEPFDFFGEVPFFKNEIRNYIVKADTDCQVLVINKNLLMNLLQK